MAAHPTSGEPTPRTITLPDGESITLDADYVHQQDTAIRRRLAWIIHEHDERGFQPTRVHWERRLPVGTRSRLRRLLAATRSPATACRL